ncbi:MAG: hypothetical protein EXS05_17700 [Planctomycetaceae bacterium]|nr:hypothetical protein [Planctomycetaceae bacterium]
MCEALKAGKQPWEPLTRQELEAALDAFPQYAKRWLPTPENLALMGLSATFGREPETWDDDRQELFLATLERVDLFRAAVGNLLGVSF